MPIKEGWLHKKSRNFLNRWEKRFFILTDSKLFYYDNEKKLKVKGAINFLVASCQAQVKRDREFTIDIENKR